MLLIVPPSRFMFCYLLSVSRQAPATHLSLKPLMNPYQASTEREVLVYFRVVDECPFTRNGYALNARRLPHNMISQDQLGLVETVQSRYIRVAHS